MEETKLPVTYLNGILLWINAINDSYLWIDSPDCFFFKVDIIYWNHDLNSNLKMANWEHRIFTTISDVDNVIWNRNDLFIETLNRLVNREIVKLCFVSSMPMSQLIWVDYDWIINDVKKGINKPIFNIPSKSMTDCWLDWYSDLLFSIAKNIEVKKWLWNKNNVAIIWNLYDRNEWDCIGNIKELKNIFKWLWLKVVSIWLEGWNYYDILNVYKAWTIISLPYWRKAAKKIAKKLGIELLHLDLPFWISNTINFIKEVWDYFNININKVDNFIYEELNIRNNIWIMKCWIYRTLFNKNISFYWDPYLLNWLIDISNTFWLNIKEVFIHWDNKHLKNNLSNNYEKNIEKMFINLQDNINSVDLFISNKANIFNNIDNIKILEFWFPSYTYHCFSDQSFYWIRGWINFINRIYNKLS